MRKLTALQTLILISVAYVATQMLSDIASLKIVLIGGLSMDAGTLIYPLTFTLRDLVHKSGGLKVARLLIVVAAGVNVIMALLFQLIAVLPSDPAVGDQVAFSQVLAPVWRIVIASIMAEVVSEWIDGDIYHAVQKRWGNKRQWARVLLSNAVSVPLDSAIFTFIAFLGDLPISVVLGIFISNMLMKFVLTFVFLPSIYFVKGRNDDGIHS